MYSSSVAKTVQIYSSVAAIVCGAILIEASPAFAQDPALLAQGAAESLPHSDLAPNTVPSSDLSNARDDSTTKTDDHTFFYAFLGGNPRESGGPLYEYFRDKPLFKDILIQPDANDHKFRPMVQMRYWWDTPQRFLPTAAFCTFIAWLFWFLIPDKLRRAEDAVRAEFWKCFVTGFFCVAVWLLFNRAAFLTHVGWPLGIVSTACFQAGLLVGLSVTISMIGHAFSVVLRLRKWPLVCERPKVGRALELLIGSLFCAALIMLPTPAPIPHATMRLMFLFALLGLGALCRVIRGAAAPSSAT